MLTALKKAHQKKGTRWMILDFLKHLKRKHNIRIIRINGKHFSEFAHNP